MPKRSKPTPAANAADMPRPSTWPASRVETRLLAQLIPYAKNARTHPKSQVAKLAAAIREWGWTTPILIAEDDTIIAGHGRVLAAEQLGIREVPVMVARGWTEAQRRAYVLADNQIALDAGWDKSLLASELAAIKGLDFDLALTGFDKAHIDTFLREPETTGATDETIPLTAEPTTRPGDLWILGSVHRLLCGDATKAESWRCLFPKGGTKAALVHTDPPYGVSYESDAHGKVANDGLRDDGLAKMLAASFKLAAANSIAQAAWYVWHASATRADFEWALRAAGIVVAQEIVWIKPSLNLGWADYQWQHEPCLYGARAGERPPFYGDRTESTVWRMAAGNAQGVATSIDGGVLLLDGSGTGIMITPASQAPKLVRRIRLDPGQAIEIGGTSSEGAPSTVWAVAREKATIHPTQKPVALVRKAILNSTQEGDLVVDPFGGSGSTLIAAADTRRCAALMELDPRIVDAIVARWLATGNPNVYLEGGPSFAEVAAERSGKKKPRKAKAL